MSIPLTVEINSVQPNTVNTEDLKFKFVYAGGDFEQELTVS